MTTRFHYTPLFLASTLVACGPVVCEDRSQPLTGVCEEDCIEDEEWYDDDDEICVDYTATETDCDDNLDNDNDGDEDCNDSDCWNDSSCGHGDFWPYVYMVSSYWGFDAANNQARAYTVDGSIQPPMMVIEVFTPAIEDGDFETSCTMYLENPGPISAPAWVATASGEDSPPAYGFTFTGTGATWIGDAAATQTSGPGCDTITSFDGTDIGATIRALDWGVGITTIDADLESQLDDTAAWDEFDGKRIGAGDYNSSAAFTSSNGWTPNNFGWAMAVNESFEVTLDGSEPVYLADTDVLSGTTNGAIVTTGGGNGLYWENLSQ